MLSLGFPAGGIQFWWATSFQIKSSQLDRAWLFGATAMYYTSYFGKKGTEPSGIRRITTLSHSDLMLLDIASDSLGPVRPVSPVYPIPNLITLKLGFLAQPNSTSYIWIVDGRNLAPICSLRTSRNFRIMGVLYLDPPSTLYPGPKYPLFRAIHPQLKVYGGY